jgi:hypothetical protein
VVVRLPRRPGLAESVLAGHEERYIDWFLDSGTLGHGIPAAIRDAFVHAYTGHDALRCAFEYYRALPTSARQIQQAIDLDRLTHTHHGHRRPPGQYRPLPATAYRGR